MENNRNVVVVMVENNRNVVVVMVENNRNVVPGGGGGKQ